MVKALQQSGPWAIARVIKALCIKVEGGNVPLKFKHYYY